MSFLKHCLLFGIIFGLSWRLSQSIPVKSSPFDELLPNEDDREILQRIASYSEPKSRTSKGFSLDAVKSITKQDQSISSRSNTSEGSSSGYNDSVVVISSSNPDENNLLKSRIYQNFPSEDDSEVVELPQEFPFINDSPVVKSIERQDQSFPSSSTTSEGLSSGHSDSELFKKSLIDDENNSLISSISKGFPPEDDSEIVEVTSNQVQEHDDALLDLSIFGSSLYHQPDYNNTARLLEEYKPDKSSVNPEELGPYLEGDILVPQSSVILKNGLVSTFSRWPNGIVPYKVDGNFGARDLEVIANAINQYHERTCIRFVPRTTQTDYISIVDGKSGCWSSIGRVGGRQSVNLQTPGCLSKPGTAIHELMHVLGFLHEQNREERDSYVSIQYQNIKETAYTNFKKMSPTAAFGVKYDYGSVMHYSSKAFSQNGQPTIVAMQPEGKYIMGQRDGFSSLDIKKINRMYNCLKNAKPVEPPVDLTKSTESSFRPGRRIRNFVGNFISQLNRVG